ncbi:hypothetical protein [Maribacter sp. ACAM166]|uniref:hypothetical protein n=1 Tax=Maribacter sp. ACAM166 TaxID=2508996 RepID=UPI0010FF43C8|nr:hypothetical protein [Maribacter sp. ACAM166]TLP74531.1 hypothetical protein ES765_15945 [Maribacter sp. ACAM166]
MDYTLKGICNAALPVTLLLLLFVTPERDKNFIQSGQKANCHFREMNFLYVVYSMGTVIGESRKMDNPT